MWSSLFLASLPLVPLALPHQDMNLNAEVLPQCSSTPNPSLSLSPSLSGRGRTPHSDTPTNQASDSTPNIYFYPILGTSGSLPLKSRFGAATGQWKLSPLWCYIDAIRAQVTGIGSMEVGHLRCSEKGALAADWEPVTTKKGLVTGFALAQTLVNENETPYNSAFW